MTFFLGDCIMSNRFTIYKGQFTGCHKVQYYIWDNKIKRVMVDIHKGGIRAARLIRKIYATKVIA